MTAPARLPLQTSRRRIEELLWIAGLNKLTTPLWDALRGPGAIRKIRLIRDFYSRLLPKNALVFDIGANLGTLTRIFVSLGARVVAVDANPDCIRHIELTTPRKSVEVLQAAVGRANGLGVLTVSDRKDKMSSLSPEWRKAVSNANSCYADLWKRELTVPMVTLDTLVQRFGLPAYIKIDVEGFEHEVLSGLSQFPPLLSFEFNKVFLQPVLRALDAPAFKNAAFNYTLVDPVNFALPDWITGSDLKARLCAVDGPGLGDIFVKSPPAAAS